PPIIWGRDRAGGASLTGRFLEADLGKGRSPVREDANRPDLVASKPHHPLGRGVLDVAALAPSVDTSEREDRIVDLPNLGRRDLELLPDARDILVVLAHPGVADVGLSLVGYLRRRRGELDVLRHELETHLDVPPVERLED